MEKSKLVLEDVDIKDVYEDLKTAIYMLHFLKKKSFSKKEIIEVAFSLRVTLNTIENIMKQTKSENQ